MMMILPAILYALALALTVIGTVIASRRGLLQFLGGLCWAAGTLAALIAGADGRWILLPTLLLLLIVGYGEGRKKNEL